MSAKRQGSKAQFRVIDAMDAPYVGRIVRLRLQGGQAPRIKDLKGARLLAESPDGESEEIHVINFPHTGGRPSDARLSRTGRVDLLVVANGGRERPKVSTRWTVSLPG